MGILNSINRWLFPQYKLTVYTKTGDIVIYVKEFRTKSDRKVSGIDTNNKKFEVKSARSLDWFIEEYYGEDDNDN